MWPDEQDRIDRTRRRKCEWFRPVLVPVRPRALAHTVEHGSGPPMTRRPHTCAACSRPIERWMRICNPCWKRLPVDQRAAIAAARQAGNTVEVSTLTRAAAAWLAEHSPAAIAARQLGEAPP